MKKIYYPIIFALLTILLVGAVNAQTENIYIDSEYNITGSTAFTYDEEAIRLTSDISNTSITVTASNITLDGSGYVLTNTTLVFTNCHNLTITGWTITETDTAVIFAGGTNNTFTGNTLTQNHVGLYLTNKIAETTVPLNVTIYQNNFYNNLDVSFDLAYSTQTLITFNNTTHGNFWYSYAGTDTDLNGIGDTNYLISTSPAFVDYYPLMSPVGEPLVVVPEFPIGILFVALSCVGVVTFFKVLSVKQKNSMEVNNT